MRGLANLLLVWVMVAIFCVLTQPGHHTEDSPGWNCHTMGNHVCGPKQYPKWERP